MKHNRYVLLALAVVLMLERPAVAEPSSGDDSSVDVWLRARMLGEWVDQDNALLDASAITVRTRVGLQYDFNDDFTTVLEAENIFAAVDDYNSTTNGNITRSVVPDPEDTEINRALIQYTGLDNTVLTVGRQKLVFDNARFVGDVAWRQNEQTFDAVGVKNTSFTNTRIEVAYIDQVRRIFGPDASNGTTDMSSPVVNVSYTGFEPLSISAYGYFLDFDDTPLASNATLGLRGTGKQSVSAVDVAYTVEVARQTDYRGGSDVIDADYLHGQLTVSKKGVGAFVGFEQLGGDGNYAFQTPLATGHAFNGWADLFLVTPTEGLVDTYVGAFAKLSGVSVRAFWHQFDADTGSRDYGSEFNLIATRSFGDHIFAGLKHANYQANTFGVDTSKTWFFLHYTY